MKSRCLLALCLVFVFPVHAKQVQLTLVQANDVYEMSPVNGGRYGGLARLQTLLERLERQNPHTYTVLAGDLISPSAIGTAKVDGERLNGRQMVAVFNAMGWDYVTFGNHEFDNDREALLARLAEAKFKVFSSNVRDATTGKPFAHTEDVVSFEVEGVKVGLVGITLQSLAKDFVTIADPYKAAREAIHRLKQQQLADIVVLVTHQDMADDIRFAEQLPDVDLIIGGHEHENAYLRRGAGFTPIAKADANARSVYIHRLVYDTEAKSLQTSSELKIIDGALAEDPRIKSAVKAWTDKAYAAFRAEGFEPEQTIARTTQPLDGLEASVRNGETGLTRLAAESALQAFPEADVSLLNAGSIRIDDVIPPGEISQYDVIRIFPFGGAFILVGMPGDILEQALTAGDKNIGKGGFLHHANAEGPAGGWQIKGKPIDRARTYKVAVADFLIERGDTGLEFLVNNPAIERLSQQRVATRAAFIEIMKSRYPLDARKASVRTQK